MTRGAARPRSTRAFRRARTTLVGGVDSPVRSFGAVGGDPVFVRSGRGAYLTDVDGARYLDLLNSWGATILGHAPPTVVRAVRAAAGRGMTFGTPTEAEHELGERVVRACPSVERVRFVNSGTEAVMTAVRVARAATGRTKVVKFEGGYHGHSDGLLARAGSGVATQAIPDSAGVPAAIVGETLVAPYNDLDGLRALFDRYPGEIAAVVVEPVAGNMGVVPPVPGFLAGLSRVSRAGGALVVMDEVITGFR
ncbi:MAG: aminotransferase class III-fold pyridoxal phosphate-dependent enzyme, partial [Thermoplasmata archaeon]|nr:aminotransferase class III-fold pyridoxal phosphate-dependent enzyme [Thermoplasmata archaeon]